MPPTGSGRILGTKDLRAGFTIDVRFALASPVIPEGTGQVLLDNRTPDGRGFAVTREAGGSLRLTMHDGRTTASWRSDSGLLVNGKAHHAGFIVDGGPKLILFVVDGVLCDGGEERQFGWGRFSPHFRGAAGSDSLRIAAGAVRQVRLYNRALRAPRWSGMRGRGGSGGSRIRNSCQLAQSCAAGEIGF